MKFAMSLPASFESFHSCHAVGWPGLEVLPNRRAKMSEDDVLAWLVRGDVSYLTDLTQVLQRFWKVVPSSDYIWCTLPTPLCREEVVLRAMARLCHDETGAQTTATRINRQKLVACRSYEIAGIRNATQYAS